MSISDNNAGRANQADPQKAGTNNPAAGQGGQPAGKGLPGLAAFGQMQAYTAAAQPPAGNAPSVPENHAGANQPIPQEPVHTPQPEVAMPDTGIPSGASDNFEYSYDNGAAPAAGASPEIDFSQLDQLDLSPSPDYAAGVYPADAVNGSEGHTASLQEQLESYSQESHLPGGSQPEQPQNYDTGGQQQQPYSDQPAYGGYENGAAGASQNFDTHNSLQTFEARYDQHPEIPLGSFDEPGEQPFFQQHNAQADANFGLGEDDLSGDEMEPPVERKSRKVLMVASALIGALALGGAVAFAYKTGGTSQLASGEAPPLIQADSRPVKVTPVEPGGKQFPHQNKQIYDRLQGDQRPEVERLVPRQEEVVAAARPGGTRLDSDIAKPSTQQVAVAGIKPGAASPQGGPHRVRTLQIKPDGTVVTPPAGAQPNASSASVAVAVPTQPDPTTTASIQQQAVPQLPAPTPPAALATPAPAVAAPIPAQPAVRQAAPAPLPQQKPVAPTRTAAQTPNPAPAAAPGSSIFVLQIASRRSQALALAAFADLQQKYTSLLGNYQPMIQSADLGAKGVWYRLRVGPMSKKAEAKTLCSNLKRAGLRSCLVRPL